MLPVFDPHGMGIGWAEAAAPTYRFDRGSLAGCASHLSPCGLAETPERGHVPNDSPTGVPLDLVQNGEAMAETPAPAGTGVEMKPRA